MHKYEVDQVEAQRQVMPESVHVRRRILNLGLGLSMAMVLGLLLVLGLVPVGSLQRNAAAHEAQPVAANPELEERVMLLAGELRCLVCQNQTIADSHADLAIDLKNQVREKLASGMSNEAVIDYMVQRYGDFVLYRPRLKPMTWLLWFGPFLLLFGGLGALIWKLKNRPVAEVLSASELQRGAELLAALESTAASGENTIENTNANANANTKANKKETR